MGYMPPPPPAVSSGVSVKEAAQSMSAILRAAWPPVDARLDIAADARRMASFHYGLPESEFAWLDDPADIEDWAKILVHRRKMRMRQFGLWLVAMCAFSFLVLLVCVVAIWR